jgi:hypothetical protein
MSVTIMLSPRRLFKALLTCVVLVQIANAGAIWAKVTFNGEYYQITEFFDVGREGNIPTIYSVLALCVASIVTFLVAHVAKTSGDKDRRYWFFLACVLLFLAFDEGATIHEHVGDLFESYYGGLATGLLYWLWVVPYGIAVMWLGAALFPFLLRLPARTRNGCIGAGLVFIGGAIGVEMISASVYELHDGSGGKPLKYYLLYTVEEFMEMLGVVIYIYYAHSFLAALTTRIEVDLTTEGSQS